ncbi:hypothetical protein SAMN05421505_108236 [Sinosporangium album]|uniref:Uncharacterized protein n=1 Tax=Sinosporangium album TaxID=504805 RepID=A0A1G7XL65_9ACTN|nr:hypothetical protein [Sinosporangium album]SDG84783.1 hypothetical protein SAMN05421505_108236 [Sinosporangium album]
MTPQSDEDEVWRQIVASFNAPVDSDPSGQPWPDSENLTPEPAGRRTDDDPTADLPSTPPADPREPRDIRDLLDLRDGSEAGPGGLGAPGPDRPHRGGAFQRRPDDGSRDPLDLPGHTGGDPDSGDGADEGADEGHYEPPPPPPLPKADTPTKLAWFALFGGPAYLLLAAMLGWHMEGWALFAAVAAFIGGFVALVVRMGDGPPNDSGWDDGAVI